MDIPAVTKDIGKIGGAIPKPVITIHKPVDPTTQLYKQFPHLKPESGEKEDNEDNTNTSQNNTNNDTSSSSTNENIVSGPISVKKITF